VSFAGPKRSRSLSRRIFGAFLVVLLAFALVSGFALWSLGLAANEARVLRNAYLPLALSVRSLVLTQDTWNSQLNHITSADNPADKRAWYDIALRAGRPEMFVEVKAALDRALGKKSEAPPEAWQELSQELARAELLMRPDAALIARLFDSLDRGDLVSAEQARDELVVRGLKVQRALTDLEKRISTRVDGLVEEARRREQIAFILLNVFASLSLLVGLTMAFYARRAVWPLVAMTRRAEAVAEGDLTRHPVILSDDEVGRLSQTFEAMVEAISEAREKLLAAERLGAVGKLAAHVTHEVRNPLSSIGLNLDLLEDELGAGDSEARALLTAIRREVGRLVALSDQYLSMARQAEPELIETDLAQLVRASIAFIRPDVERHGVQLELEVGEDLPWVLVDPGQVRQVLYNLVRNAREALVDHGRIVVTVRGISETARESEAGIVETSAEEAQSPRGAVELAVTDNGPGVPLANLSQVFDPFFTTKEHGTGLGLALTRQMVEAHGGSLGYEEPTGGGSRFVVTFPLRSLASAPEESP
jgi:two-component system, NtrC family, sensor kinase